MATAKPQDLQLLVAPADSTRSPRVWNMVGKSETRIRRLSSPENFQGYYTSIFAIVNAGNPTTTDIRARLAMLRAFSPTIDHACAAAPKGVIKKLALHCFNIASLQEIIEWMCNVVKDGEIKPMARLIQMAFPRYYAIMRTAQLLEIEYLSNDMARRLQMMLTIRDGVRFSPPFPEIHDFVLHTQNDATMRAALVNAIVQARMKNVLYSGSGKDLEQLFVALPVFAQQVNDALNTVIATEPADTDGYGPPVVAAPIALSEWASSPEKKTENTRPASRPLQQTHESGNEVETQDFAYTKQTNAAAAYDEQFPPLGKKAN